MCVRDGGWDWFYVLLEAEQQQLPFHSTESLQAITEVTGPWSWRLCRPKDDHSFPAGWLGPKKLRETSAPCSSSVLIWPLIP